jgi:hypothetical protein
MKLPDIHFGRAVRDGGIHASAALNHALAQALETLPVDHGLSTDQLNEVKRVFGGVMAEIFDSMIGPALRAFPELEPSQATWSAAVVEQTKQVGQKAAINLENASTEPLFRYPKR